MAVPDHDDLAVAIVGMGALFPGAPDLDTFWANVAGGVDAISDAPADRLDPVFFDPSSDDPDRFYCRRGGFLGDLATFDPAPFGIMPLAVEGIEPDQLIALRVAAGRPRRRRWGVGPGRPGADRGDHRPGRVPDPRAVAARPAGADRPAAGGRACATWSRASPTTAWPR